MTSGPRTGPASGGQLGAMPASKGSQPVMTAPEVPVEVAVVVVVVVAVVVAVVAPVPVVVPVELPPVVPPPSGGVPGAQQTLFTHCHPVGHAPGALESQVMTPVGRLDTQPASNTPSAAALTMSAPRYQPPPRPRPRTRWQPPATCWRSTAAPEPWGSSPPSGSALPADPWSS